jgi:hypothetical protein
MRQAFSRQRLAWTAAGLAMVAAVAGCSSIGPTQPSASPASGQSATSFKTEQAWLQPAFGLGLLSPGASPLALGALNWGRPYAAGYGYPLVLPHSSLWVGSGIELLIGTWPYRSSLYGFL